MPAKESTYHDHAKRQRIETISKGDTLTASLTTCMCIAPFAPAASAGYVAQHLLTLCSSHAGVDCEEVHEGEDSKLWQRHACTSDRQHSMLESALPAANTHVSMLKQADTMLCGRGPLVCTQ